MRKAIVLLIVLAGGILVGARMLAQPPAAHSAPQDAETPATAAQAAESMAMGHHHHHGEDAGDPHMKMTALRTPTPEDQRRADAIVRTLRVAIEPYRDADRAQAEGYQPFLPNLVLPQYHFTNWVRGFVGTFSFDAAKPTSLLYRKHDGKYELTGAMYTASARATEADLNARVPLGIAQWHAHVNICLPPARERPHADWTRFGFAGSIATREACEAAGGEWHPQIFGWMVHIHPFETDPAAIWTH
jgi:hypothetical protein